MYKQFIESISELSDIKKDRLILAISGGVDSVVLAHLLKRTGYDFALAHCNFKLRGFESEEDEYFIRRLAEEFDVPLFVKSFDTPELAKETNDSVQMLARSLRYAWLESLLLSADYNYIVTAHHLNDNIETLLLNLIQGCGIRGLHGILPKNEENKRLRPLLFASKDQILEFANKENINFRNDSSNLSDKYKRNKIRNKIIPLLKEINPSLERTFADNFRNFKDLEQIFQNSITNIKNEICEDSDFGVFQISIQKLNNLDASRTVLFELLKNYGFNTRQVDQIFEHLGNQSGAIYYSEQYKLLRSYDNLILQKIVDNEKQDLKLFEGNIKLDEVLALKLNEKLNFKLELKKKEEIDLNFNDSDSAYFDFDLLNFPLIIRKVKDGDSFQPFGLKGKNKKLSNFFKDLKLSVFERENVDLLLSGNQIIWVLGYRSDHRFSITTNTKYVLKIMKI